MFKFQKLNVWKKAVMFCDNILKLVENIPQKEQFSLGEQLRKAAISIPTNIAEGTGRGFSKEQKQFFNIAKGSTYEVINLLVIMGKRNYLTDKRFGEFYREAEDIAKMLSGLLKREKI